MPSTIRVALLAATLLMPASGWAQIATDTLVEETEESEDIIVQATRSRRRVQDEPTKVEVLAREEIEEKILMRPGNIATILSETGGLRVQVTSPALGASNIRIQGMDGRYTQLLADGLPLYGGQASSLGLLQIAPTDLGQVEVIKGAASALYGASALGGVINLVSRRPGPAPEAELLLNGTSRGGQDATAYAAAPLGAAWSGSLTGGLHRQSRRDLDGDGWSDISGYRRGTLRSRLFWAGPDDASAFVTLGAMRESRHGGTEQGRVVPDGRAFPQDQRTKRFDAGVVVALPAGDIGTVQLRGSAMLQDHRHRFGAVVERDRHATFFAEASLAGDAGGTSWLGGVAWQLDRFRSKTYPAFDYGYRAPGLFAQVERDVLPDLTLSGSGRIDVHNVYGTQASPRVSLLYKPGAWTVRASGGRGFFAPTPFVDEIEAAGLSRLDPLRGLRAETATTGSLDIGYARGAIEANVTLFAARLRRTTELAAVASDRVALVNVAGARRIAGGEWLLRYRRGPLTVTASYVHIHASEPGPGGIGRRIVPLTPRHSAGLVAMWEKRDRGRIGAELYYTGRQPLDDDPYRRRSRPYVELGMLGEIVVGPGIRLFLNAENILDVRQTRYAPLVRPTRTADGRWTVDAWGPTEGFVLNGGVRLKLGGRR